MRSLWRRRRHEDTQPVSRSERPEHELEPGWELDSSGRARRRVTVAQAEAENMVRNDRLGPDPVPFGFQREKWQRLVGQMREGDELWEFSSSPDSWHHLAGRAGIELVREGKVVDTIVTMMT